MQDFRQLKAWQRAHGLVLRIYTESKQLPASENLGLTSNLRRSAVTIPRSIAEGCARDANAEFAFELRKARAAAYELEYILLLCRDLRFFSEPLHDDLLGELTEVGKMISGLMKRVVAPADPLR